MKSKDGKAFATLQLQLGDPPPTPPLAPPHHHPRRQGPSRLRRFARRTEARTVAAAGNAAAFAHTTNITTTAADDADPLKLNITVADKATTATTINSDAIVQTIVKTSTDASVQVDLKINIAAVQAGQDHQHHLWEAAQASSHQHRQHVAVQASQHHQHRQAVLQLHQPLQAHVRDVFCPDIPQLDGSTIPDPKNFESSWSCKCCKYEQFFHTEDQLDRHHREHMMEYEECNICYDRHVWT